MGLCPWSHSAALPILPIFFWAYISIFRRCIFYPGVDIALRLYKAKQQENKKKQFDRGTTLSQIQLVSNEAMKIFTASNI
jgi:hypothetical protein